MSAPNPFLTRLDRGPALLADGAMGTSLNARGIGFDRCLDALNLTEPALIAEIHRGYIEAGAELVLTNTFGANRFRMARYGLAEQVGAVNRAGVELARRAILASFKDVLLAGDVGPLGVRMVPFGRVRPEQARSAFRQQISALSAAGVDLLFLETFSDLFEIREALRAAHEVCSLPIVACMSFTRDDRTLLGNSPAEVAGALLEAGADVIGVNCSQGPAQLLRILEKMSAAAPQAVLAVKPNAGLPEQIEGRFMYPAAPNYFAEYALAFREAGARLIGGCCGTTCDHVAAMRTALDTQAGSPPASLPAQVADSRPDRLADPDEPTGLAKKLAAGKFVTAVEMSPPHGLGTQKIVAGASLLADAGADVINITDSPMARLRMAPWAVCKLVQERVGIETTLHFPTRGRNLLRVQSDLLAAHALNVRNIFVVMGDPTAIGDYPEAMDDYDLVPSGLIRLIKQGFNLGLDYGGSEIGEPTTFFVGCALNPGAANAEREYQIFRRKIDAGADFALTQPIFEAHKAAGFLERYDRAAASSRVPIIAGILPLYSLRHALFLNNEVPGIEIPEAVLTRLEEAGENAPREGLRIAGELIERARSWAQGIYLMPPFGKYDLAAELIEGMQTS